MAPIDLTEESLPYLYDICDKCKCINNVTIRSDTSVFYCTRCGSRMVDFNNMYQYY